MTLAFMSLRHKALGLALAGAAALLAFGDNRPVEQAEVAVPLNSGLTSGRPHSPMNGAERLASTSPGTLANPLPVAQGVTSRTAWVAHGASAPQAVDLFQSRQLPAPPAPKVARVVHVEATEAPDPGPPPWPYQLIGKKDESGTVDVFLARDQWVFSVRQGQTLEGQYRIQRVAPPVMTVEHVPTRQVQQIPIGGME